MGSFKNVFLILVLTVVAGLARTGNSFALHIPSGDLYYECLPSGQFQFYLTVYRDCSILGQTVSAPQLKVFNVPGLTSLALTLSSTSDATPSSCGYTCADGIEDISVERFIFVSAPISLPGPPPTQGYSFVYEACCRNDVQNLVNSTNALFYFGVTMYPFNSQDTSPCYDSSPQFAENPSSLRCSGYELRYNSNAIDPDQDSLSYSLTHPLGANGTPIQYQAGFSQNQPLPGPNSLSLDPVTGQFVYQSNAAEQGSYAIPITVDAWRCGQLISRTVREMTVSFIACTDPNDVPSVTAPVWASPGTATGYGVTVQAGDLVNFSITANDPDLNNGVPQIISFTAAGTQFGTNFTNAASGCLNPPCATLSNVSPPSTASGTITTTFNWQTDCSHVVQSAACATITNTYNFLFKFNDDFCPATGSNVVNVSVTVVGDPIIDSPDPHCVSTDANGDITLSWAPVIDNNVPPSFVEYVILHSTSPSGPFQEVGTVTDINTGTYMHNAANAVPPTTAGPNYYLIRTRSGCNDAVLDAPVDTVSSIYLTLNNTGTTANLSWTPVAVPTRPSSTGQYQVYREYPAGTWSVIGTTAGLSYVDLIIWCNELINYRIELADNLPCTSISNVVGDVLNNPVQPDPQPLDSVTVDPVTGYITVCWPPNTSLNVVQYNILLNPDAFAWIPMDTVYSYNNTCWTDSFSNASTQSLWYQVYATNNCGVSGIPAGSISDNTDHHETILLETIYDSCQKNTLLFWNRYWYWPEGVKEYDVYTSENAGPYYKIGTTSDTLFIHDGLQATATYCYVVRAVKNVPDRVTSTSNRSCIVAKVPKRPDYGYNYNTTVQAGNTGVEEYFFVDSTAGYIGFHVQRGTQPDNLSNVWFVPFDPGTRHYQYTDASARPAFNSYYYSVIGVDSCELNADTLNMSRTILLNAEANPDRTNSLEWNPYEGWNGNVAAYNIHRSVDGVYALHATVPPTQLTFTDSIQEIIIGEGNFCYIIEAVEGIADPIGDPDPVQFQELSRSNEDCALQHPNVFVPNAFAPEGVNNVFRPVTVYVNSSEYLFQIYNRWGQRIFESNDPETGWNGSEGGKPLPQGTYAYFIKFVSSKGVTYTKSGTVSLIR